MNMNGTKRTEGTKETIGTEGGTVDFFGRTAGVPYKNWDKFRDLRSGGFTNTGSYEEKWALLNF